MSLPDALSRCRAGLQQATSRGKAPMLQSGLPLPAADGSPTWAEEHGSPIICTQTICLAGFGEEHWPDDCGLPSPSKWKERRWLSAFLLAGYAVFYAVGLNTTNFLSLTFQK